MLVCIGAFAQSGKPKSYLEREALPNPETFLPGFPEPGSIPFLADSLCYEQGKALRTTPRGAVAVDDAGTSIKYVMKRFGDAIGVDLNPADYPKTAELISRTMATGRLSISKAKKNYARQRPYQHFGQGTPVPAHESPTDFTSYPSGHSVRFWIAALTLCAVAPEYQNEFLQTGYEMGRSRVIVGYHYKSDVDDARLVASACFARLVADDTWIMALREASAEFKK